MPFTGDSFTHLFDWEKDPQRQEKIVNARLEAEFDGVDTGLSAVAANLTTAKAPQYVTLAASADLPNERVLTAGNNVTITDGGAGGAVTIAATGGREVLTAARTYYVRTDGSNSNTGLVNNAGGAFLTIQKAIDTTAALDLSIYDVTIQVADGTYTGANTLKTLVGAGKVNIVGNTGTPANIVISVTSNHCFIANGIRGYYSLSGMKLQTTTLGSGIAAVGGGARIDYGSMDFGAMASGYSHVTSSSGADVQAFANYNITGGAFHHIFCQQAHVTIAGRTITLTGTPAFTEFVRAYFPGLLEAQLTTFSGAATGQRHGAYDGGVIYTNGGGASYFPGSTAGVGTNFGVSPYGRFS